jgi:hypothetical protein
VKLHTLLDLRGSIPTFVHISDGKVHDVNVLDLLTPEPGAVYVLVAIIRKQLDLKLSLHSMLQIVSVTPFEKSPLFQLLTDMALPQTLPTHPDQLILF